MVERKKLSEAFVKGLEAGSDDRAYFDSDVSGFAVVVYKSGSRAFVFLYRHAGRQRRLTIGKWPDWSVTAARERCRILRREVDGGADPQAERKALRAAPRVEELVRLYVETHLPRLAVRNASDQKSMLEKLVLPRWRTKLVAEVTPADVEALLSWVASGAGRRNGRGSDPRPTPVRANRLGEVLRKMFVIAMKAKMRPDNPAADFRRRLEEERERFLSFEELGRLCAALDAARDRRAASVVIMLLLTGARLSEVLTARFRQFDLELGIWSKPAASVKSRRVHRVPISAHVVALIRLRQAEVGSDVTWLFPGDAEGKPLQDIRRFWERMQAEAGIPDVRLHDLRHSFASFLVSGGASLEMIGRLLGHTQAKTTQRYAHLMDSPLRAGVTAVGDIVRPRLRVVGSED